MYLLTELVRLLEQRGHIFPSDPQAITDSLRQTDETPVAKLQRRASMIDRHQELRDRLDTHRRRLHFVLWAATIAWFIIGFSATYGLMQHSSLNFFFLLAGTLGINTIMLLLWLVNILLNKPPKTWGFSFLWARENDSIGQAIIQLYAHTAQQTHARWQRSMVSHRLALSGLLGMFCATLLLLTVRQYSFNWQSTLLANETFANAVNTLAWIPAKLGFSVPDTEAIISGRNTEDTANAAQWGSLLLGSLVCYGIVPRAAAWCFSLWKSQRTPAELDLKLPYYQNIIQQWQRKIIDSADDYQADEVISAPPISISHTGEHWAVLLDTPYHDETWFERQLGQDWFNQGVLSSRDDIAHLVTKLEQQATQLLVGVRAQHVPDRGTVRTLQRLAQAAQNGLIVQLLLPENIIGNQNEVIAQWRETLKEHGWTWLEMPR